jgi:Flp pilus assembly pilin Flp
MTLMRRFLQSKDGVAVIDYALIAVGLSLAVASAMPGLGLDIGGTLERMIPGL